MWSKAQLGRVQELVSRPDTPDQLLNAAELRFAPNVKVAPNNVPKPLVPTAAFADEVSDENGARTSS